MKIKFFEFITLIAVFHINPIRSLIQQSQLINNTKSVVITSELLKLYKNSEAQSDKINLGKVTHNQCEKCSKMKRSIDRILPRRKRYLIYPSASNVVVTMSLVKALTFTTPRGYNLLGEIDLYYPLPDKIYLPHPHTTTTEAPPPVSTEPPEILHHDYEHLPTGWDHDHSNEIFMPPGGWNDNVFKNINADPTPTDTASNPSRRYWNENLSYRNAYSDFRPPSYQPKSRRRYDFGKPKQFSTPVNQRGTRSKEKSPHDNVKKLENHDDWEHYKSHRDRRDLYSQIESIFEYKGVQFKMCILRALCEAKYFLLPKGKSLFQDIFRILFTIPTKNEMNDDYSEAIRSHDTSENCWKLYENECPISILEILLKSQKVL